MTNQQHITDTQRLALAKRVATLSADKKALFRETLEKEGIDPWQLPIVPQPSVASESPSSDPGAPLSFAQQRLWLIEQMEQGNSLYNLFFALRFDATLEPNALSQALHAVVQKHPILRTNYRDQQGGPRQIPQSFSPFEVPLTLLPQAEEQQEAIADAMARVANTPFDLASDARLLRVELLQIPANTACEDHSQAENKTATAACYIALFCIHHIAFDAISMHIFMQELSHFYSLALAGDLSEADVQLPADEVQYSDFATWQRDWSQSDACAAQADYWQQQLQDAPAHLPIATRYRRPLNRQQLGAEASLSFSPELSHQIRQFAAQSGATL